MILKEYRPAELAVFHPSHREPPAKRHRTFAGDMVDLLESSRNFKQNRIESRLRQRNFKRPHALNMTGVKDVNTATRREDGWSSPPG
jgi:hypothetical protein